MSSNNNQNKKPNKKKQREFNAINNKIKNTKYFINSYNNMIQDYIIGILDPQVTVEDGKTIKQPSLIPIPSATTAFRVNVNISTDDAGDFFLAWNPSFLVNKEVLNNYEGIQYNSQYFKYNTFSNLVVKNTANSSFDFCPGYVADISLSKYRLVSAKIKVTYIGSNLERSGMMYACASFDPTPIRYGYMLAGDQSFGMKNNGSYIDVTNSGLYPNETSTYNLLTEANISNGIWNNNVNIVQANQGVSCLHIPVDPTNEIFYPLGSYFGNYNSNRTATTTTKNESQFGDTRIINTDNLSGSQLCYLVCGHGLPKSKECINIQVFYNFEIIATPTSAPYIKMTNLNMSVEERNTIKSAIRKGFDELSIRKEVSNGVRNWKKLASNLQKAASIGFNIYRKFHK